VRAWRSTAERLSCVASVSRAAVRRRQAWSLRSKRLAGRSVAVRACAPSGGDAAAGRRRRRRRGAARRRPTTYVRAASLRAGCCVLASCCVHMYCCSACAVVHSTGHSTSMAVLVVLLHAGCDACHAGAARAASGGAATTPRRRRRQRQRQRRRYAIHYEYGR
jgi:hypothetical protein